ncbi:MAG: hypothetical protein IIA41_08430 [SAR324 cluster bacterium]|nr:hypothetical protein [SAR324 cluster bacterium]
MQLPLGDPGGAGPHLEAERDTEEGKRVLSYLFSLPAGVDVAGAIPLRLR